MTYFALLAQKRRPCFVSMTYDTSENVTICFLETRLGRYRWYRRHALPGYIARGKHGTVSCQHSYRVSGIVGYRAKINTLLLFRLGLVLPLHLAVARLEER